MSKKEKKRDASEEPSFWADAWDFIKTLLISMIVVFLLAHYVVRPIRVQGSSMYPTLENGSLGFADAAGYSIGGLKRFDIAIIYLPEQKEYLVKRVIGLPGDRISYQNGQLYVNDEPVSEDFLNEEYRSTYGSEWMPDVDEVTVGEDEYYCLGDNRPNSRDSRYYGCFSKDQIIAKGAFIIWPFKDFGVKSW